jgi:hypothetical protein
MKLTMILRRFAVPALLAASFFGGCVVTRQADAAQWKMLDARRALNNALAFLNSAEPDKGGFRVKAIADVNQAIGDVNAGIAAGREHR